jgi:hypothetical protein
MKRGLFIFVVLLITTNSFSQSITPFTVNIGGFSQVQNGYQLTVSTGETISITNYTSANGLTLSSGFLQSNPPLVTGIEDVLSRIATNEISITPNPTTTFTNLVANFSTGGQIQYQVLDATSKLLYRSAALTIYNSNQNKIELSAYPSGTYYIQVFFKPTSGTTKSGIYKIVKL